MKQDPPESNSKTPFTETKPWVGVNGDFASSTAQREVKTKKQFWKSMVGNTTFTEARNLAVHVGCERLFLKFEGSNPTGTQKDRIAMAIVEQAKNERADGVVAATCGNFGTALAYAARIFNIPAQIYIPKNYHVSRDRLKRMQDCGANLHYVDGHYEDAVLYSSELSQQYNWYNANPHSNGVTDVSLKAYSEIALEIYRDLRRVPTYIFCPVGNGTTLAGIHHGFKMLYEAGRTSMLPRIVATSTRRGNPIVKSYLLGSKTVLELTPEEIRESKVNEPLTNWRSFDGQEALDAIYESKGFAEYASDIKMIEFARLARQEEGLNVLPASASTLAVLSGLAKDTVVVKGTFVAILTGRNFD